MDELEKLERDKDAELAHLKSKMDQLAQQAAARKTFFEREIDQLKAFIERASQNLDAALSTNGAHIAGQIEETDAQLQNVEKRLQEILQETNPAQLEKKLKSIEDGFARQSGVLSASSQLEIAASQYETLRRQLEERIGDKTAQISRMREALVLRQKEIAAEAERSQKERADLLAKHKAALEKKERAAREAIRRLESELGRRRLRLQEASRIVEAREAWLEQEKSKRLENIKALVNDLETRTREFQERLGVENQFWQEQVKALDQEIGSLNMKMVTGQAELAASRTQTQQQSKILEEQVELGLAARQAQWEKEITAVAQELSALNQQAYERAGRLEAIKEANRVEMENLERQSLSRQEEILKLIRVKEGQLAAQREAWQNRLREKREEVEKIRLDYEAKVMTPALLEKRRHLAELEEKKRQGEARLAQVEEEGRRQKEGLQQEIEIQTAALRRQEEELKIQARQHQEKLRDLSGTMEELTAPQAKRLGELKKTLDLLEARHKAEMEELEHKKANVAIDVDHQRVVFESAVEEKRREVLFAIENLRAQWQAQTERSVKEQQSLRETLESARSQAQRLAVQIEEAKTSAVREIASREEEMVKAKQSHQAAMQELEVQISKARELFSKELAVKKDEMAKTESEGRDFLDQLKKRWQDEEVLLLKRRSELMGLVNEEAESAIGERTRLKAEIETAQAQLRSEEEKIAQEKSRIQALLSQVEQRRVREIGPLEEKVRELGLRKAEWEAAARSRLEILDGKIETLKGNSDRREKEFSAQYEASRKNLFDEISGLEARLSEIKASRLATAETHQNQRTKLEKDLETKRADLERLAMEFTRRRQELEAQFQQEEEAGRAEIHKGKEELDGLQKKWAALEAAKKEEVKALELELERLELGYQQQFDALDSRYRREKDSLERSLVAGAQALEKEAQALSSMVTDLSARIKDVSLEIEVLKSQREVELAEMAREKRRSLSESRIKRTELAQELRQARRVYQDRLRDKEHDLYLMRLKVDLRSKRIEELLAAKRQELDGSQKGVIERTEKALNALKERVQELLEERGLKLKQLDQVRSQKKEDSRELERLRLERPGPASDELAALQTRSRRQLEAFKARMEELLKAREAQRVRLSGIANQMEPINKELSESLVGLLMNWETQMRRMENLVKGIEESPFWRH